MNSYRWSAVTVKSIATVPVKKACKSARVCSCSSFILITMPRIMIEYGHLFRLKPRWIHVPRSDSNPIGQCSDLLPGVNFANLAAAVLQHDDHNGKSRQVSSRFPGDC